MLRVPSNLGLLTYILNCAHTNVYRQDQTHSIEIIPSSSFLPHSRGHMRDLYVYDPCAEGHCRS